MGERQYFLGRRVKISSEELRNYLRSLLYYNAIKTRERIKDHLLRMKIVLLTRQGRGMLNWLKSLELNQNSCFKL
jgi:hypothetical protein